MEEREIHKDIDHYDVFISYAHKDNVVSKGDGWITMLHKALEVRANQLLTEDVKIWRDDSLQLNDDFSQEIKDVISKSHAFISIVTPRYINSRWCERELETFIRKHEKDDHQSIQLGNKKRLFKVVKLPVDRDNEPPPFKKVLGINFYREGTNPPIELIPSYHHLEELDEGGQAINKLAYAIQNLLSEIREGATKRQHPSKGKIYLAETSSDLSQKRNELVRELEDRNYTVLPRLDFPRDVAEIEKQMQQDLGESLCSIHLVGEKYGLIPEDTDRSVVEIQVDKAFEHGKKGSRFLQLIWLSEDKELSDNRQIAFREKISYLDFEEGKGEYEKNSFENFKIDMQEKLDDLHESQNKEVGADNSQTQSIYLIHTKEDRREIITLIRYLREKGCEVLYPVFEGPEDVISRTNQEQLENANGALIFWGKGDEAWFHLQCKNVRGKLSSNNKRRLKTAGVILANPKSEDKEYFLEIEDEQSCRAKIISSFCDFSPDSLKDFLATF